MYKDIKSKVHFILQKVPKARDCYNTLYDEYQKRYSQNLFEFSILNDNKMLNLKEEVSRIILSTPFNAISRARREIQAENEHLRGKLYGVNKDREKLFRQHYGSKKYSVIKNII